MDQTEPTKMTEKNNHYTLITGASSGIGLQMAHECAKWGQNLIMVALPNSGLRQAAEEIKLKYSVHVIYYCIDLAENEGPERLYQYTTDHLLKVNILINNVGTGYSGMLGTTEIHDLKNIMYLNNFVMVTLTRLFINQLKDYGQGAYILNVGSLASFIPIPGKSVYSASKAFVLNFSIAMREELKTSGVSVSCLCPGPVITSIELLQRFKDAGNKGNWILQSPEEVARIAIRKLLKGKKVIHPSLKIYIISVLSGLLPDGFVSRIAGWVFRRIAEKAKKIQISQEQVATSKSNLPENSFRKISNLN
ncbi:MAG: SDR family NAD(P)-dependent oxidoreductase [Cyclobacteriaceae bacterium]|nr:SDR family NAD(P)-dependent oxidoreductase [Cyclobacteriaceae bacterium]